MKGIILGFEDENSGVVLLADDDKRYRLARSEWKSEIAPLVGMKADFVIDGETAKEAFCIPQIAGLTPQKRQSSPLPGRLKFWWRRVITNIGGFLPSSLRSVRPLVLILILLGIVAYVVGNYVEQQIQEAKAEREAPVLEAAQEAEDQQNETDYQKREGYAIGVKMWQFRIAGLGQARTEGEIEQFANYVWNNASDTNLQELCSGWFRSDSPGARESFVGGFVQGYEDQIRDFNRRNQPLY